MEKRIEENVYIKKIEVTMRERNRGTEERQEEDSREAARKVEIARRREKKYE